MAVTFDETRNTEVVTPKTVSDVLNHAALYIEEHGWVQGVFYENGRVCLLGAISQVAGDGGLVEGIGKDAHRDLSHWMYDRGLSSCISFNDSRNRTREEVLDVLRGAARDLA